MKDLDLSPDAKAALVSKIKDYFETELEQDIGGFQAEFLIDFFAKEIGATFYNQGLEDARRLVAEKTEELGYLIEELEQPTS